MGLQCPKLLWIAVNKEQDLPKKDISAEHKMKEGTLVGELAKKYFGEGIDISCDDFIKNIEDSKKLLKERKPLFEAGFKAKIDEGEIFSRADVLFPVGEDEWDIIEVKSGTSVKEPNTDDVSFQKFVYEKNGLKIRKSFLMHINNTYVKNGEIEPKELFVIDDITEEVKELEKDIEKRANNLLKIINAKKEPKVSIGQYCGKPYECGLKCSCWDFLPEENVFELYRGGKKSFNFFDEGIQKISEIPVGAKLTDIQKVQYKCSINGECNVDDKEINKFLKKVEYPIYYLDFETFNPAVPLFDGMKPYQRIPFQFSLHIQEKKNFKPKHISFLAKGTSDPRPKFLQALKDNLGDKGTILVYNESFEKGVMTECCEALPEFQEWLKSNILPRVEDLLHPFRNFHYYHPKQKGSASIKKVLPMMSDLSYDELEISNGSLASIEYERVTFGKEVDDKERSRIRKELEKYCEQDTLAEVLILEKLWEILAKGRKG